MTVAHTYQRSERGDSVGVFLNGEVRMADQSHPAWGMIVKELNKDNPDPVNLINLFDNPFDAIRENVAEYSTRVRIEKGEVILDGNVVGGPLAEKIVKVYGSGGTVKPLVKFLENLDDNPSHRSRDQLFAYLMRHDFQITDDGHFIAYKGLTNDGKSIHSGRAFVDGVEVEGQIPNELGALISMPRREISDDPNKACHVGLHAGAWSYAHSFGHNSTAKVKINPADVVCIPNDSSQRKMRVCCYEVIEVNLAEPNDESRVYEDGDDYADPWDEAYYDEAWEEGYYAGQHDASIGVWG